MAGDAFQAFLRPVKCDTGPSDGHLTLRGDLPKEHPVTPHALKASGGLLLSRMGPIAVTWVNASQVTVRPPQRPPATAALILQIITQAPVHTETEAALTNKPKNRRSSATCI